MVTYLVAIDPTFFFPLLFERFSVCLSFVYLETMFSSHRSLLARHVGPLLVFEVKRGDVYLGVCPCFFFFFFPKQLHDAVILAYISSFVVSLRCVFCPRYLNSVTFSIFSSDLLVCLCCLHGLSCTLSFLCVFLSQLSDFFSLLVALNNIPATS